MFNYIYLCVSAGMHYGVSAEVRRQLARDQFLHSTMRVLGIELGS